MLYIKNGTPQQGVFESIDQDDAKTRIESLPLVDNVTVEIVWDPDWSPKMMSDEGKRALGLE